MTHWNYFIQGFDYQEMEEEILLLYWCFIPFLSSSNFKLKLQAGPHILLWFKQETQKNSSLIREGILFLLDVSKKYEKFEHRTE